MIWMFATLFIFYSARIFASKVKHPVNNPLLVSMCILIPILLLLHIPYSTYFAGNAVLNFLLEPAVVALAFPLYEQLPQIRQHWRVILWGCLLGSICAIVTGTLLALYFGATPELAASVLPKSITTPIAMAVSHELGGEPSITAMLVVLAGLFGAILGYPLSKLFRIEHPIARGLTIGTVSHALGTATAAEKDYQEGAFSSLALVICGIFTSLLAPIIFPFLV